jgi:fatty acid desaturase
MKTKNDPIAEADVYMAYGRPAQAAEILIEAIKTQPARAAEFQAKLDEIPQASNTEMIRGPMPNILLALIALSIINIIGIALIGYWPIWPSVLVIPVTIFALMKWLQAQAK